MASSNPILIIGGGIGGLTTALALLRRGLDVTVYEQAPVLREVGAGVQIGSNGTHVLYALGLKEALARVQVLPPRRVLRHWRTGETWDWFDLGAASVKRYGTPHLLLHRTERHSILVAAVRALKPDAIKRGMRANAVAQTADAANVQFADGQSATGTAIIAADGIHGPLRQSLFGPGKRECLCCVAWRRLIAMGGLPPRLAQLLSPNWIGPHGHVLHY